MRNKNPCVFLVSRKGNEILIWSCSNPMVTDTLLTATEFRDLYAHVMMLPPLTFRANSAAGTHPLMYVMYLATAKEAFSLHVTTTCVKNSYTLLTEPSLLFAYVSNPSSDRSASYHRGGGGGRLVADCRQEVT